MADTAVAETAPSTDSAPVVLTPSTGLAAALDGMGGLPVLKQIGLMIGFAASIAIGLMIAMWSQEPSYRPLYTDISNLEAGQVAEMLDQEKIQYKVDTNSGMLLVESSRIHDARIKLAQEGLPTGKTLGYELLDKEQAFGTSQFMEKARYFRSIEGELARTISSMSSVRNARVHLAVPKRSVFVNDTRHPSASVFVELYSGQGLKKNQVSAIVHLVASSIPELDEAHVAVVDQRGRLLSEQDSNSDIALAARQMEYTEQVEDRMIRRIANILEPLVGPDSYKVQVAADIDFSVKEQTAESFNPDLPAMRSEQTLSEYNGTGAVNGIPGALSNQPPGAVSVPEKAGQGTGANAADSSKEGNVRNQATRNFELDRTISHTRHGVGRVERLTVAVVLDDKWIMQTVPATEEGADPTTQRVQQALSDAEIERINILVRDAIGYSAARGDSVSVVNQPFTRIEEKPLELPPVEWWKESWAQDYIKLGLAVFGVLILFFGVLRPIFKKLASNNESEMAALHNESLEGFDDLDGEGADVTLSGNTKNPLLEGPGDLGYDEQVDKVKSLVAEDPKRVAQVIKTWLQDE